MSELPDGLRSNANPILRLGESQRGVRILSYRSQRNKKTTELFGLGCPFIWRRKRDSNPRGFWPNGFQDRLVVTASIFLHITATHRAAVICREYLHGSEKFIFQNPLRIPHEVIGELAHQWRVWVFSFFNEIFRYSLLDCNLLLNCVGLWNVWICFITKCNSDRE